MTALLAGCGNVLEITQWIHDQREVLIGHLEIRTVNGKAVILSQASVYRFLWRVESQLEAFEQLLLSWLRVVTMDAGVTEQDFAKRIVKAGGRYLMQVKKNQPETWQMLH